VDGAREEGRTDNFGHPTSAATQLIPYGKFALERGVVGRGAKLDDRFHETSIVEVNQRGTGRMLVDSSFEIG